MADDMSFDLGESPQPYRVLARKYRPSDFTGLIGQEALVKTLSNAFASGRIAHAFMLTGVRGVGKTTTARIIARALNCVGPDGTRTQPSIHPCGVCDACVTIAESRNMDVLEIDAASNNGVDEVRQITDAARYAPASTRYKIYILDEVHMLSKAAFNAILKTLEEPPPHVKFIFATTEIRKVPVTVLSRCQRFDLRRIESTDLSQLFGEISKKEGASVDAGALALIARAADGSARDGLSILDQAISQSGPARKVSELAVRDMLGLADRALVFDLFDAVMSGEVKKALDLLANQYAAGASPVVILQDLLELVHWLTRMKVAPDGATDPALAETERTRGVAMAGKLSMPVLTRSWQMLLKGLGEARAAPMPLQAVEMVLVRMAYAADLPSPADAVKALESGAGAPRPAPSTPAPNGGGVRAVAGGGMTSAVSQPASQPAVHSAPVASLAPMPETFAAVVELFNARREAVLATHLARHVNLVRFEAGLIEFNPSKNAPKDLSGQVGKLLTGWTGQRWVVSVVNTPGLPSLHEQEVAHAAADPLVKSILEAFPGATIDAIRRADEK